MLGMTLFHYELYNNTISVNFSPQICIWLFFLYPSHKKHSISIYNHLLGWMDGNRKWVGILKTEKSKSTNTREVFSNRDINIKTMS